MLFLAMSCLQSRPQLDAFLALLRLCPDGIQLTPGNAPTAGFRANVEQVGIARRFHHGFVWDRYRRDAWDADGRALVEGEEWSVHPPSSSRGASPPHRAKPGEPPRAGGGWLDDAIARCVPVETMYPGEALGTGAELEAAMARGARLAVDVSHLFIQRTQGVLGDSTLARVLDYDRIVEVHVSANDGTRDQHKPIAPDSFGLAWARERMRTGTPVVLECYMHRLDDDARRRQLDWVRG